MEILTGLLEEAANLVKKTFGFHPKCLGLHLSHLCFGDDLLIFSAGNLHYAEAIESVLEEFEFLSGLSANPSKSTLY